MEPKPRKPLTADQKSGQRERDRLRSANNADKKKQEYANLTAEDRQDLLDKQKQRCANQTAEERADSIQQGLVSFPCDAAHWKLIARFI
eukprot:gene22641-29789_t